MMKVERRSLPLLCSYRSGQRGYLLLLIVACLLFPLFAVAQTDQCAVNLSISPASPVAFGTPVTVNAQLTGDIVVDTVNATVNIDSSELCTLSTTTSTSTCVNLQPLTNLTSGTHTLSWNCTAFGIGGNGSNSGSQQFTVNPGPSGSMFPKYLVLAVAYAPPGQKSSVDYGASTAFGTTTTLDNSVSNSQGVSVSLGLGPVKVSSSTSWTQAQDTVSSVAVNKSSSSDEQVPGPADSLDGINHDFDVIYVWLNPELDMVQTGLNTAQWAGYSFDPRDPANEVDVVPLFVTWLKNPSTIPPGVADSLNRTWAGPGQGLTTDDLTNILGRDPFANGSTNIDPARFDLQGGQTFAYEPAPAGGQPLTQKLAMTYNTTTGIGETATDTYSVGFSVSVDGSFITKLFTSSVQSTSSVTWTNKASAQVNRTAGQTATLSLTGPASTYTGPTDLQVYKDNIYGTFMFAFVPNPTFNLSSAPSIQTISPGGTAVYNISTSAVNGFTGNVDLSTPNLPADMIASFSSSPIAGAGTSILTVSTDSALPPGTYSITVAGTSGLDTRNLPLTLVVNPPTDGVTITSPSDGATLGTSVRVTATAQESNATIGQMQVWDNGGRLGIANGSSIDQTYTLAPGAHRITVEDLSAGTFTLLHKSIINITVAADGVTVTSPANNATVSNPVRVTATAFESSAQIGQMQIWDNGKRLGIANGASIDQTFTLALGAHRITVEDLSAGTFSLLHQTVVNITVQ